MRAMPERGEKMKKIDAVWFIVGAQFLCAILGLTVLATLLYGAIIATVFWSAIDGEWR